MSRPPIETSRLALRPVAPSDRADLAALDADPEVMRHLSGGRPVAEAGEPGGSFLTPRGTEPYVWAAHERATGAFVGWFSLYPHSTSTAELGYRLRREAWGRGLATEGARALVEAALGPLGYDLVRGETMAVNAASRRVMEKAGLRHVDTVFVNWPDPLPGSEHGEVVYEARRADGPPP